MKLMSFFAYKVVVYMAFRSRFSSLIFSVKLTSNFLAGRILFFCSNLYKNSFVCSISIN